MFTKREVIKAVLNPMLNWTALDHPVPGYSIILGVPWALRHLLAVNLRFVGRQDLADLERVHIVFDRPRQPGGDEFIEGIRRKFPELPLDFQFHPPVPGRIVERVHKSKFYAAMNWTLGLIACRSRYAILHDFDLYPTDPRYFASIHQALKSNGWAFGGYETTHFDGLTPDDLVIGSWNLGLDAQWVRSHFRPIDCFHVVAPVKGRPVDLDPFSHLQIRTENRGIVPSLGPDAFAHVVNLCSTYLRFVGGHQRYEIAWRLHSLWYLESLSEHPERIEEVTLAMRESRTPLLTVAGTTADFTGTHVTCSNVLAKDLARMEQNLFGGLRPEVETYIKEFKSFLKRIAEVAREPAAS